MSDRPSKPPRDDASVLRIVGQSASVGFEFLATVLLPVALGYWLDGKWHTRPWVMIGLGVFGFGVGLWRMLQISRAANE